MTLRAASLSFFEKALTLPLAHGVPVVVIPSPSFTYRCLFSAEPMSLSRICGIISLCVLPGPRVESATADEDWSRLRETLTGEHTAVQKNDIANTALVVFLNAYLVEFVNALWSKKFLSDHAGAEAMGLESCVSFPPALDFPGLDADRRLQG